MNDRNYPDIFSMQKEYIKNMYVPFYRQMSLLPIESYISILCVFFETKSLAVHFFLFRGSTRSFL